MSGIVPGPREPISIAPFLQDLEKELFEVAWKDLDVDRDLAETA